MLSDGVNAYVKAHISCSPGFVNADHPDSIPVDAVYATQHHNTMQGPECTG